MSIPGSAYEIAASLHSQLFHNEENQVRTYISDGEVRADISEPYRTQRLVVRGEIGGRRAYQQLSKSQKNGAYYLTTNYTEEGGEVVYARITTQSPEEMTLILEESLFMQALKRLTARRH